MGDLGEVVVVEALLNLDGLAGLDKFVHVGWHRTQKDIVRLMQVRSAVIPAAGLGTRFLPATKAVPKELFPIGDRPAIQIVIDEALGAGCDHIVVVSSRSKPALDAYFAPDEALLELLDAKGRTEQAERLRAIGRDWSVDIVYQDDPKGLGHAVGCAARQSATNRSP